MRKRTAICVNAAIGVALATLSVGCSTAPTTGAARASDRSGASQEAFVDTVLKMADAAADPSNSKVLEELERAAKAKIRYVRAGALGVHVVGISAGDYQASLERLRQSGLVSFVHEDRTIDSSQPSRPR